MHINKLNISNFRNLKNTTINPVPGLNFLIGDNGSGKTSILESIYYLSCGKSFRSSNKKIINFNENSFLIFAELQNDINISRIALQFKNDNNSIYKLNRETIKKQIEFTKLLPILFIGPDTIDLTIEGPEIRRAFIDWGLFYQDIHFYKIWMELKKILNQRNAALKARLRKQDIIILDKLYVSNSYKINKLRKDYLEKISNKFYKIINDFLPNESVSLKYYSGWNEEKPLQELLETHIERDIEFGYTREGCHRADIYIKTNNANITDIFSRGQLKLVACSLKLAQGDLLTEITRNKCVYLIDDIYSELDDKRLSKFAKHIINRQHQTFITSISQNSLDIFLNNCNNIEQYPINKYIISSGECSLIK